MPETFDSPAGLHHSLRLDHVPDHPDGPLRLWLKSLHHVMSTGEARILAQHLTDSADAVDRAPVPAAAPVAEAEAAAPPAAPAEVLNGVEEPTHASADQP